MATPKRVYDTQLDEIVDRVRRVETRLTKYMEWQKFDTQVARATWTGDRVLIPSPAISLQELLSTVPTEWSGPILVFIGQEFLVTIHKPLM